MCIRNTEEVRPKGDRPEDDLLLAVIPILPKADVEHFVGGIVVVIW